jgi:hypothetical protein
MTRALDTLPEAIGWTLVLIASVVGLLVAAAFVLWLIRYAKDCAEDRRREREYADAIVRRWRTNQDLGRYEYDVPGQAD